MDDLTGVLGHWTAAMLRSSTPLLRLLGRDAYAANRYHKFGCGGSDAWRRLHGLFRGFRHGRSAAWLRRRRRRRARAVGCARLALSCVRGQSNCSGIAVWTLGLGLTSYFGRAFIGGKVKGLPTLGGPGVVNIPLIGPIPRSSRRWRQQHWRWSLSSGFGSTARVLD